MKPRDPRRWLDQSGPETEMERALLDVGREMDPPPRAKDAVWAALVGIGGVGGAAAGGAAGGAAAGGAASGGASTAATGAAVGKAAAGGAALGSAAAAGAVATTSFGAATLLKVTTIIGVLGVSAAVATGPTSTPPSPAPPTTTIAESDFTSPTRRAPQEVASPPRELAAQDPSLELVPSPLAASSSLPPPAPAPAPVSLSPRIDPNPPRIQPELRAHPAAIGSGIGSGSGEKKTSPTAPAESSILAPSQADAIPLPPNLSTLPPEARVAPPQPQSPEKTTADPVDDIADQLADEAALVRAARRDLRQGHARAALTRLEQGNRAFAGGTLEEERKVLTIEALVKTGATARARSEAADFLRAYPTSTHAARLRALVPR